MSNPQRNQPVFALGAALGLALVALPATRAASRAALVTRSTSSVAYNSEEHTLIADRGAALVNTRSAVLPGIMTFLTFTSAQVVGKYQYAKNLAVGFGTNNQTDYDPHTRKVQDHSYWTDRSYGQLAWNKQIYIPTTGEVPTRTLYLVVWDGRAQARLSFGELVALYGDYRRTVSCTLHQNQCYLTNRDQPQYVVSLYNRPAGIIDFAYGDDCFDIVNCGWRPDTVATSRYLRAIAAGLLPPFGALGNQFVNTAYASEELDAGWWGDEMLRIANVNDWHFSQAAVAWYVGMHRLALRYVFLARTNPSYWNLALHYEAAALHSLTDLFAFGHVVTSRDRTSWAIMGINSLRSDEAFLWQENASRMGGGVRESTGEIRLTSVLPSPIADLTNSRNDFMESDRGSWALVANREHTYHDTYNNNGATVMNLKRQEFDIYGDGKIENTSLETKNIMIETVRASLQSLFDAYESPRSEAEVGAVGSSFFDALLNIPIYVVEHPQQNFWGQWTRYAAATDAITRAGVVPLNLDPQCVMPFVDGESDAPPVRTSSCSTAVPPSQAAVVGELLHRNDQLGRGDQAGLDDGGNRNGGYDVGDFLAWVRRTEATPASLSTQTKGGRQ